MKTTLSFMKSFFLGSSFFFLMPHTDPCLVFPPQSNVAFRNSKTCSGFVVSFPSAHQTISCYNFAIYDSIFDFWLSSSITTVHDVLGQAPHTLHNYILSLFPTKLLMLVAKSPLYGTDMTHRLQA
jgi:hypothetical protein